MIPAPIVDMSAFGTCTKTQILFVQTRLFVQSPLAGVIIRPFTHMYMEGTSAAADGGDVLELKTDTHV